MAELSPPLPPVLPDPPVEYSREWAATLLSEFQGLIDKVYGEGTVVMTKGIILNAPTTTTDQKVGTIWNDSGTLKIVT